MGEYGDNGWIGYEDYSDAYCYDNEEVQKQIQNETYEYVSEIVRKNAKYFETLLRDVLGRSYE